MGSGNGAAWSVAASPSPHSAALLFFGGATPCLLLTVEPDPHPDPPPPPTPWKLDHGEEDPTAFADEVGDAELPLPGNMALLPLVPPAEAAAVAAAGAPPPAPPPLLQSINVRPSSANPPLASATALRVSKSGSSDIAHTHRGRYATVDGVSVLIPA